MDRGNEEEPTESERREAEQHHKRFDKFGQHSFVKRRRGIQRVRQRRKAKMKAEKKSD